jgi:SAM-dependent methyltransferase
MHMSSVPEHYANLLAPVYSWMLGGAEAAFALGESDLASLLPVPGLAVDLGAGIGMHAIPLARAGWRVLAIDASSHLLSELESAATGLPVSVHCDDIRNVTAQLAPGERVDLVICMGDTLTHLDSLESVAALGRSVAGCLAPRGRFIATFRDYTHLPSGTARFIPVRSDDRRILTCFLEESGDHVQVHDMLHERTNESWTTKVSSYRKLRLKPETAAEIFAATGLRSRLEPGPRGMVRLVADA